VRLGKWFWVGEEIIWHSMKASAPREWVLHGCGGDLAQGEVGEAWKRFWVGEEVTFLWVKAGAAWEGVLGL
jgi:hypothetical protein